MLEVSWVDVPNPLPCPRQNGDWQFMPAYWAGFPRAGRWLSEASQRLVVAICLMRADYETDPA